MSSAREQGIRRYAVIAPPGIGKTYIAAFDAKNSEANRVLFVAHREFILQQAKSAFAAIIPDVRQIVVSGKETLKSLVDDKRLQVFAMIQTLGRSASLEMLPVDYFDYIVIDKFHHSAASQYRSLLGHFKPQHLLGLTATPERMDGQDVLAACDRNVAYELRLPSAINRGWLSPFHYYAIYDQTEYDSIKWTGTGYDEAELEKALSTDTRADLITSNSGRPATRRDGAIARSIKHIIVYT